VVIADAGIDALRAWLVGAALGAATGIPLGVVNVAVVEAAARASRRRAIGIGLGGATADAIHAALAFAGVAPLVARRPALVEWLTAVSALAIVAYAIVVWRSRPAEISDAPPPPGTLRTGIAVGLGLTLPNPAPLLAWVAVASAVLPRASIGVGLAGALGVGVGSAVWFAVLGHLASRGRLRGSFARWLPRVVALALVGFAAIAAGRLLLS
jgi:threonine/homoserine/homoserine lactone efflux protein